MQSSQRLYESRLVQSSDLAGMVGAAEHRAELLASLGSLAPAHGRSLQRDRTAERLDHKRRLALLCSWHHHFHADPLHGRGLCRAGAEAALLMAGADRVLCGLGILLVREQLDHRVQPAARPAGAAFIMHSLATSSRITFREGSTVLQLHS